MLRVWWLSHSEEQNKGDLMQAKKILINGFLMLVLAFMIVTLIIGVCALIYSHGLVSTAAFTLLLGVGIGLPFFFEYLHAKDKRDGWS